MKSSNTNGFTIIEVILFLAITGLLVAGVLASTGGTINSQRYQDSIASLKSTLQMQYTDVTSVSNVRDPNLRCNSSSDVSIGGSTSVPIGQSDCVILGKVIRIGAAQSSLSIKDVIGYPNTLGLATATNDIDVFRAYNIKAPGVAEAYWPSKTYDIEWGSSISRVLVPAAETPLVSTNFTILVLKSPVSGMIHTYINSGTAWPDASLSSMINITNFPRLNSYVDMCIDSNGLISATRKKMAVRLYASATSASGVEIIGDQASACP